MTSEMRSNINKLFEMVNNKEITAYRVAKEAGMSQIQISNLINKKSSIDNISFSNAESLSEVYLELRK